MLELKLYDKGGMPKKKFGSQSYHVGIEMRCAVLMQVGEGDSQSYHVGIEIEKKKMLTNLYLNSQSYHVGIEIVLRTWYLCRVANLSIVRVQFKTSHLAVKISNFAYRLQ